MVSRRPTIATKSSAISVLYIFIAGLEYTVENDCSSSRPVYFWPTNPIPVSPLSLNPIVVRRLRYSPFVTRSLLSLDGVGHYYVHDARGLSHGLWCRAVEVELIKKSGTM